MARTPKTSTALHHIRKLTAMLADRNQVSAAVSAREAQRLAQAMEALEAVAANRNPSETPEAHALRVNRAAQKLAEQVKASSNRINDNITEGSAAIQNRLDAATGLADNSARGREIRDLFRTMKMSEQLDLLKNRMNARDNEMLGAILSAPPYLTGLDPDVHGKMREMYENKVAPEIRSEITVLYQADELARAVVKLAGEAATDAAQPDYIQKITAAEEKAQFAQKQFDDATGDIAAE